MLSSQKRDFAAGVYLPGAHKPHTPPLTHCNTCIEYTYLFAQGRGALGRVEPKKGRGATGESTDHIHKAGSKIPT